MPVHDVGYRPWKGTTTPLGLRWWTITLSGFRLAIKSRWIKRIMLAAWLPVMYWGVGFFLIEKGIDQATRANPGDTFMTRSRDFELPENPANDAGLTVPEQAKAIGEEARAEAERQLMIRGLKEQLNAFPESDQIIRALETRDTQTIRKEVWRWLLMVFFRYPQSLLIVFLVGSVAPALISRDIRSRAFLLYFSRPIGRLDYIVGKMMIPAAFIVSVTTLPALALYLFAVLMSPDLSVLLATWDIPFRILVSTVVLVIPTASIALMLSSLTQESRFAIFAWFAIWVLGHGAYLATVIATAIRLRSEPFSPEVMDNSLVQAGSSLSLYNCLGNVQSMIFGFADFSEAWLPALILTGVTLGSWALLYRRVSSPIRI